MDHSPVITDHLTQLLHQLGFASDITFTVALDDQGTYQISLQTPDPSFLIGYHGETLTSLQYILSQHLHAKLNEWLNLSLNVNDYKERRERTLYDLADSTVTQVLAENQAYALPPLPAHERRLIHMYLAAHPSVTSYSEGEGRARTLIIAPKSPIEASK